MVTKEEALKHLDELEKKVETVVKERGELKETLRVSANAMIDLAKVQKRLESEVAHLKKFEKFEAAFLSLKSMVGPVAEEIVEERLKNFPVGGGYAPGDPSPGTAELPSLIVNVDRPDLVAEDTTLRGALAILISEGFFDAKKSIGNARNKLKAMGLDDTEKTVEAELVRLCQWRFLERQFTDRFWYVATEGAKVRVTVR